MKLSALNASKKDIEGFFNKLPNKVFTIKQIKSIINDNRELWKLSKRTTAQHLIDYIIKYSKLKKAEIPMGSIVNERYLWNDASDYETILSFKPNAYFSHYTAMFLNKLTQQVPKTIYLNHEQLAKYRTEASLQQDRINYAFSKQCRMTKNITQYNGRSIYILNGKNTGQAGVDNYVGEKGEMLKVTNIERTLIDITVRPIYAGGVNQVVEAFRLAAERVSINKLAAMLKKLDYIYPFHQAIGLYLEKAGNYRESQVLLMQQFDIKYDFYLTYQMKETDFSEKWKIFYPKGL
jgi:predicted transcriptional regulator of viral defense system